MIDDDTYTKFAKADFFTRLVIGFVMGILAVIIGIIVLVIAICKSIPTLITASVMIIGVGALVSFINGLFLFRKKKKED